MAACYKHIYLRWHLSNSLSVWICSLKLRWQSRPLLRRSRQTRFEVDFDSALRFTVYGIRSLERGRHAYTAPHVIGEMLPVKLIGVQIHDCYWGLSCKWLHTYSRVYFSCITLRGENVVWIPCPCNDPFVISVIKMSSAVSLNYGAKFWGQHAAALTTLDQVKISYNILYFSIVILVV